MALPTLPANAPLGTTVHHLLADTDAALARQTLLQVASLPDRADGLAAPRLDQASPRWSFEIPFAVPAGTAMAQFEISRDGGNGSEAEAAKQVWRARFSLDVEPAGPVHALVSLTGDKTSVRMWAERPATALQLQAGTAQLNQALIRANLQPGRYRGPRGRTDAARAGIGGAFSGSRAMIVQPKRSLAVALHYDKTGAPVVTAKGKGAIGEKIIEVAKAHDIPIEENEVLAGALSNVEIGDEISSRALQGCRGSAGLRAQAVGPRALASSFGRDTCQIVELFCVDLSRLVISHPRAINPQSARYECRFVAAHFLSRTS